MSTGIGLLIGFVIAMILILKPKKKSEEQKAIDDILNLPKCYKTGGICRYQCKGLCKESQ